MKKLLVVKIISAVDEADEAFKLECEGKYINSIAYCPGGFEFHSTIEEAVKEELDFMARLNHEYELSQPIRIELQMKRKHMFGFKEIEFHEVSV